MLNSGLFHLLWPLNYDMENRIGWAVTIEVMQGDLIFLRGHQQEAWQPLCLTVSWNRGPLCSHLLVSLQAGSCLSDRVVFAWCGVFLPALHFPHTQKCRGQSQSDRVVWFVLLSRNVWNYSIMFTAYKKDTIYQYSQVRFKCEVSIYNQSSHLITRFYIEQG